MFIKDLTKKELLQLLKAYNKYILGIVEDLPLHVVDRVPVTVLEFFENDFQCVEEA